VDASKVAAPAVAAHLAEAGVSVQPYESFFPAVEALAARGARLWLDPARVSLAVKDAALAGAARAAGGSPGAAKAGGARGARKRAADGAPAPSAPAPTSEVAARAAARAAVLERPSPVVAAKAVKNAAELAGMREAHLRDGVALARFLCWLEKAGADGVQMDEVDVDRELTARRAAQAGFIEPSFPTIAGASFFWVVGGGG
jgi:Xaa-Pro aminopeptidase